MPIALKIAQFRMDHGDHGWWMAVVVGLVLIALIAVAVWMVRTKGVSGTRPEAGPAKETPKEILDRRLAMSEITPDEYKERAAILGGQ